MLVLAVTCAAAGCLAGLPCWFSLAVGGKRQEMLVVVCCPTTVTLPAAGEVVWLMGPTHVVKEATSRRWDTHPPASTSGQGYVGLGEPWGWRWFAGAGWWGKPPNSPTFSQ